MRNIFIFWIFIVHPFGELLRMLIRIDQGTISSRKRSIKQCSYVKNINSECCNFCGKFCNNDCLYKSNFESMIPFVSLFWSTHHKYLKKCGQGLCRYKKTSYLIYLANELTGFYIMSEAFLILILGVAVEFRKAL